MVSKTTADRIGTWIPTILVTVALFYLQSIATSFSKLEAKFERHTARIEQFMIDTQGRITSLEEYRKYQRRGIHD